MLAAFLLGLFGFIALNIPISFALVLVTVLLMVFSGAIEPTTIAQSIVRGVDSFPLMAIPFFMLAGDIMNVGGISKRIVYFAKALLGHVQGGLGYVTTIASMVFAGVSGSAVADTAAVGSILLPIMQEEGYDVDKSTALICASGTIGPIIPPSIPMILFGVVSGVSVVKLFMGGIIPGILIGVGLMIGWYFHAKKAGYKKAKKATVKEIWVSTKDAIWALFLPVIILGGIVTGIYTPTEAAVVAVVYALVIGLFVYKELKLSHLPELLREAAKGTSTVMLICGTATAAGYLITTAQIPTLLANTLTALSGDNVMLLMLYINILLLLVGCVMDLTPAILILAPIMLPIVESFGLSPIYFGVVMTVNLCIGLITPPVGTVLYVGCGLSGRGIGHLAKPVFFNIAIMVSVLMLITYVPELILYIPNLIK